MVCQERGAHLKFIPIDDRGELIFEEFEKLLTERTKLVSIAHIANATGTLNPIEEIIKCAHARGAKVLIDGAQSAAHLPVDVQKLGADFSTSFWAQSLWADRDWRSLWEEEPA